MENTYKYTIDGTDYEITVTRIEMKKEVYKNITIMKFVLMWWEEISINSEEGKKVILHYLNTDK